MAGNFANVKIAVNFVFYEINQDLMSRFHILSLPWISRARALSYIII